jgi:hypothetical protein
MNKEPLLIDSCFKEKFQQAQKLLNNDFSQGLDGVYHKTMPRP